MVDAHEISRVEYHPPRRIRQELDIHRETADSTPLTDLVDRLAALSDDASGASEDGDETGGEVSVGRIVRAAGEASGTALMLAPAALAATPLSGIPGFSLACGVAIAAVALQLLIKRDHVWLPGFVMRRTVDGEFLGKWVGRIRTVAGFVDRHTRTRLSFLVRGPGSFVLRLVCFLCGAAMPFLEVIPFTSSIMAGSVTFFSTALLVRDGLVALMGVLLVSGGVALTLHLV